MTTKVYELSCVCDVKEYEGFGSLENGEPRPLYVDGRIRHAFGSTPEFDTDGKFVRWLTYKMSEIWKPLHVVGNVRPWNDYPCHALSHPVFSRRAVEALRDLLEPNGELLPVVYEGRQDAYYAYNVTNLSDALDVDRTVANWDRRNRNSASWFDRYEFHEVMLRGETVFRIRQQGSGIHVTEVFVERVRQHRLEGMHLSLVWPLASGEDWRKMYKEKWERFRRKAKNARRRGVPPDQPLLETWRDC